MDKLNYGGSTSIISEKKKIAQLIIARLDGKGIKGKFKYYQSLVKKGIGGFIIFGGNVKEVSNAIKKLQNESEIPLFIASDLEQGLGQQIGGGTIFPPAMAIRQAIDRKGTNDIKLLRKSISIIAQEAKAVGINVIFAPVVDVNTNPRNPIICTRAFSDNPEEVAWFGNEFIRGFQKQGLIACAKHFPGHGDTTKDSHRELPVVKGDLERLNNVELYPFTQAIRARVKMIMVGHLKVPAIDSRFPTSLSKRTIKGLLRNKMKFQGIVATDAMNMRAVRRGNRKSEGKACLMALNAGANMLLHPDNPEKVIDYLSSQWNEIMPEVEESLQRILKAKKELSKVCHSPLSVYPVRKKAPPEFSHRVQRIGAKSHWKTAKELTQKSIKIKNSIASPKAREIFSFISCAKEKPVVLIIDDDNCKSGNIFVKTIKNYYPKIRTIYIDNKYQGSIKTILNPIYNKILIAAVFSKISAWKGRAGLSRELQSTLKKAVNISSYSVIAGFCCPYLLREFFPHPIPLPCGERGRVRGDLKADAVIEAYPDASGLAQEAAGKIFCDS